MEKHDGMLNIPHDAELDLGKKSCGDLAIGLMLKMREMPPGGVLKVRTLDDGAVSDIPAWCRMTKNELVAGPCGENGTLYFIKKGG